ncbi:MAG: 30S ribosomal protein S17 [Pseudomonadota bacterium]|nr:30S ribosomal protein S17 [Pseudomonadota bacterium]
MSERKNRVVSGVVVSDGMDKTVVVRIQRQVKHPIYGKYIRRSAKVSAHDENNECKVGDLVSVVETRPLSKTKSWRLESIDERAVGADAG